MTICVSEELSNVRDELQKRGYNVVNSSNKVPCDAIICNLKEGGLISSNVQNSLRREGTLIIDIGHKSIDEIEYILNNKLYSTIF